MLKRDVSECKTIHVDVYMSVYAYMYESMDVQYYCVLVISLQRLIQTINQYSQQLLASPPGFH